MTTQQEAEVRRAFGAELAEIGDDDLRAKVVRTWVRSMELSGASDLDQALPFLEAIKKPGVGVEHVRSVTRLSLAIAETLAAVDGVTVDRDVLLAGALLHDVGKLLEHAPEERHVLAGHHVLHAFSGVHLAMEEGLPREVLHVIAYHSIEGQRLRRSLECEIVYRADYVSLDAIARRELDKTSHDITPYVYLPAHF